MDLHFLFLGNFSLLELNRVNCSKSVTNNVVMMVLATVCIFCLCKISLTQKTKAHGFLVPSLYLKCFWSYMFL
jgi:hypothetical protein